MPGYFRTLVSGGVLLITLALAGAVPSAARTLEKVPLSVMELREKGFEIGMGLEEYQKAEDSRAPKLPSRLSLLESLLLRCVPDGEKQTPDFPDRSRGFWERRGFPELASAQDIKREISAWKKETGHRVSVSFLFGSACEEPVSLPELHAQISAFLKSSPLSSVYVALPGGGFLALTGAGNGYFDILPTFGEIRRIRTDVFRDTKIAWAAGIMP